MHSETFIEMRRIAYLLLLFAFCLPSNVEADSVSNMFIQDEPYLETHVMSKRWTAVSTADGEITENIIRDSDIVVLVLQDQAGDGDSIVWRISLGGISKVIDVRPRDIRSYAFIMTSETLGCWMKRTYGEELVKCSGGDSWGGGNWEFDGTCSFICEVYSNGNLRGRSQSGNYLLEVLPDYPTVDVLKAWYDEDIQCPVASIKMNYPNADLAYLTVIQYLQQCWDYVEGVIDENSDRYYDVEFAEWGNTLYLTSSNRYGLSSGPQVRILPTDVKTVEKDKPYIAVSGNMVHVQMEGEHRVGVFSVDGRACASSVFTDSYSLALDKGLYIVRVSNCESNKIFVKSIIVK